MTTFILVAGAWHGPWCWERLAPLLQRQGCTTLAPDLPGLGDDKGNYASVTLDLWSRAIADLALTQPGRVILVGHSRAGAIISQAAEYVAGQLAALVYVSGMLLPDGTSVLSFGADGGMSSELAAAIEPSADGQTLSVRRESIRPTFYHCSEDEWAQRAAALLRPEPVAPNAELLHLSEAEFGRVPRFYVECLRDAAIPPAAQRRMYTRLPCRRVIALDTDHSPFYSAPAELAVALLSIASELSHS